MIGGGPQTCWGGAHLSSLCCSGWSAQVTPSLRLVHPHPWVVQGSVGSRWGLTWLDHRVTGEETLPFHGSLQVSWIQPKEKASASGMDAQMPPRSFNSYSHNDIIAYFYIVICSNRLQPWAIFRIGLYVFPP